MTQTNPMRDFPVTLAKERITLFSGIGGCIYVNLNLTVDILRALNAYMRLRPLQ